MDRSDAAREAVPERWSPIPAGWPARRVVLVAAAVFAAVWAAAGLFRALGLPPGPLDVWWNALMASVDVPPLHAVAAALAVIGTGLPAVGLTAVAAVAIGVARGWGWGVFVAAAVVLSELDVIALKSLAMRMRPDSAFGIATSFPSGHTANAAVLGTVVLLLVRRLVIRIPVVAYVVAMAWSRTLLHAHWLTDVVGGLAIGAASGVLLLVGFEVLLAREARSHRLVHARSIGTRS